MTIGERIRAARKDKGLTQKQLADSCGMADSAIRKYESGKQMPKMGTLMKIANALKVPFTQLSLSKNEQIALIEKLQPTVTELLGRFSEVKSKYELTDEDLDVNLDDGNGNIDLLDKVLSNMPPVAYYEITGILKAMVDTTSEEKFQIFQYIKFLKTQRKDDDTELNK